MTQSLVIQINHEWNLILQSNCATYDVFTQMLILTWPVVFRYWATEPHIQRDASSSAGTHYVDQAEWPLEAARPVSARAGDVLVFSYLLVHGSYSNTSDRWDVRHETMKTWAVTRERRMFLIQVAAGEDSPTSDIHRLASYVQVLASCLNAKCLQIALCWHGIKRNQQGPTRRSGQKTWKLKKWGLRLYIVRKCMQQCTFWSPIDMTLIMQLEIFIDNENKFIYSKNLISQLLIILSPLHTAASSRAHCMQTPGLQHIARHSSWAEKCGKTHFH